MITYCIGNLLEAQTEALVNTVNTVGVMGKGIALQFKERFPSNNKKYVEACKTGALDIGKLLIVDETTLEGRKIIINFPTKRDWKHRSAYAYIESGLEALVTELKKSHIKSLAIPPLGCGNGGLDWAKVKPMMVQYLNDLPIDIQIYEPNEVIKAHLQKEVKQLKEVALTDKRAMLLYAMFNYELSMGENVNVFVANKLAYFLQRVGEPMRLTFQKAPYGPFSPQVAHVLYHLNGTYLKGLEQFEAKPFESLLLNYDAYGLIKKHVEQSLTTEQRQRLASLQALIQGFESFLALEVLATVDFLKKENPEWDKEGIIAGIGAWSMRKEQQMSEGLITIALERLSQYESTALSVH